MTSPRDQLLEWLTPVIPEDWKLVGFERALDVLSQTTVQLKQSDIEKLAAAPVGVWSLSFTITLIDPHTDFSLAEPALDDDVLLLFKILDRLPSVNPTKATKVLAGQNLAYDITVSVITQRDRS